MLRIHAGLWDIWPLLLPGKMPLQNALYNLLLVVGIVYKEIVEGLLIICPLPPDLGYKVD